MPEGLARYGLDKNPYFKDRELDALLFKEDKQMLVEVDGFAGISDIDKHIQAAIKSKQPPFFMITGKSGTGRSSLANHVLMQYCHLAGIPAKNLVVPAREYKGHDKVYTIKQWFAYLRTAINKKKVDLAQDVKDDLQTYLRETVDATLEPNFQDIASRISDEIGIAPWNSRFACCMENVEDFIIVDAALSIFAGVPTICIFTVPDYSEQQRQIIAPFREKCKKLTGSAILELTQLSAVEARKLVDRVWEKCSKRKNPFDLDCIEQVFGGKHRSIGLTLTVMANLIDNKLANHPNGDEWPDAQELGFTCEQLRRLIPMLEKTV